jgi:hypothetical protein
MADTITNSRRRRISVRSIINSSSSRVDTINDLISSSTDRDISVMADNSRDIDRISSGRINSIDLIRTTTTKATSTTNNKTIPTLFNVQNKDLLV